jgi:hypothetical protein
MTAIFGLCVAPPRHAAGGVFCSAVELQAAIRQFFAWANAELKVAGALSDVHRPRCRNDLRATGKPLCLLINLGRPKVEIRRITAKA